MAIISGGILAERGQAREALLSVMKEIKAVAPRTSPDDYAVDIAMCSWHEKVKPQEFTGVEAGPVGRTQRRFIIWHSVPAGLETPESVRDWLVGVLPETARLVREHLPARSRAYPAEALALEIEALRRVLTDAHCAVARALAHRHALAHGGR